MVNIPLNEKMLKKAVRLGKHRSPQEAAQAALTTYIQEQERRQMLLDLAGQVDFWPRFDPKDLRRQRQLSQSRSRRG